MGNVEFDLLVICWGFLHLNQATICLFIRHIHLCVWGGGSGWVHMGSVASAVSHSLWPMDYSSSVQGILQIRILEWVAKPSSRESPKPTDQTLVYRIEGRFFTIWATREVMWLWIIVLPIACVRACSVVSDSLRPHVLEPTRLCLCPWNFPGKNTGIGCYFPLQGIFPTQGPDPRLLGLLHWQASSFPLCHLRSPNKDASDKLAESSP